MILHGDGDPGSFGDRDNRLQDPFGLGDVLAEWHRTDAITLHAEEAPYDR